MALRSNSSVASGVSATFVSRRVSWTWGWRSILMLQFQLQFSIAIALSIVISSVIVLSEAAYAIATTNPTSVEMTYSHETIYVLYAFDVVYFIDLMLMTIYKSLYWSEVNWKYVPREHLVLFIEYVTLVPVDGMYYAFSYAELKILYILRLRYAIRIFRLFIYYRGHSYAFVKSYIVHFMLVVIVVTVTTTLASCIAYIVTCQNRHCIHIDTELFKKICYMFLSKITGMGASYESYKILSSDWLFLIAVLLFFCNMFLISSFICDIVILIEEKFSLVNSFQRLKIRLARAGFYRKSSDPHKYINLVQATYNLFWRKKRGITQKYIVNSIYLPAIKSKEIMLDMSWNPLKHSHFFRNQETPFLRYLSSMIQHTYMVPGDVIYQKGQQKSKFVYIMSGVIQILSEEDDETPIISLSDGTCFGETCLFIDYKATSTVICKEYCETAILERKDFIKIAKLYPNKIRTLLNNTICRHKYANCFATLANIQITDKVQQEEMHIKWLKYILRKLLFDDGTVDSRKLARKLESTVFCAKFLDMLVIAQEIKLVTDTVFLKKTFPYIFQPSSPALVGWNRLVTIIFIVHALIYLYVVSVVTEISYTYVVYHAIISICWVCDLYIEMSTAIQTSQHFLITIKDIISYKTSHFTFLLNILSAMCPGLLLKMIQPNVNTRYALLYECNKLLKVYKIELFFQSIKFSSMRQTVALLYLKYVIYMILLLLYSAGFLVLTVCFDWECTDTFKEYMVRIDFFYPLGVLRYGLLHTVHFFCNFHHQFDAFHHYNELLVLQSAFFIFQVVFIASRTSAEALRRYDVQHMSEYARRVHILLKAFNGEKLFHKRAYKNLIIQYKYDGTNFLYGKDLYSVLSRNFLLILRYICYKTELMKFPIFTEENKVVLEELTTLTNSILLYKHSVIVSEGDICTAMYLIQLGHCVIKSHKTAPRILGPGDTFCVFETCMQTTSFNTIITLTTCRLLVLEFRLYQMVMIKYDHLYTAMNLTVKEFKDTLSLMPISKNIPYEPTMRPKSKTLRQKLGIKRVPLKRKDLPKWGIGLRFVLMPYTFSPDSIFMLCWEILRWFFAFATCLLLPSYWISCNTESGWYTLLILLDCTSWIDIYFRHHVMYHSQYGLEISHPYFTAVHYWKHAFLLDVIASFPVDVLYHIFTNGQTKIPFVFRLNKLLQLYRINGVVKYFSLFNISHIKIIEFLKYGTLGMVAISIITAIHFNAVCDLYENCTAKCVSSLVSFDSSANTTTTWQYYNMMYLFTSSLFLNNYYEFNTLTVGSEETILMIVGLLGYLYWAFVLSNVIAINLTRDLFLISYQNALKDLIKFIDIKRLDKRLKKEIVAHFEYLWHKKQGIHLDILKPIPGPAKNQILFEMCGLKLLQSSIFYTATEAVIRNLLDQAKHQVILKTGIIYRVNDVLGTMYFLFKGKVEVIGADGSSMQFLSEGSMLGTLDNTSMSRQTLTMTACGHVELLAFSSVEFHKILSKHPPTYKKFLRSTYMNVDFIENEVAESLILSKKKAKVRKMVTTNLNTKLWLRIFRKVLVILAMLSFVLETYHISTLHHSALIILVLYLIDVLYVLKIILKFNTAYTDEFGILIRNKSMIAARYKKNSFLYDLCSVIPSEVISIFFLAHNFEAFTIWWTYLRINRVVRVCYVLIKARKQVHELNTNNFLVRTTYCTLILFVYLNTFTVILCLFDSDHVRSDTLSGTERFQFYLSYAKVILQMLVKTTITYDLNYHHTTFIDMLVLCMMLSKWMGMNYIAQVVCTMQIGKKRRNLVETFCTNLKIFMELEYLSRPLQKSNNEYLASLWTQYRGEQSPRLLEEAPYYLKEGVLNSMFGVHLRTHEFFKKCHVDLIRQITACFKVIRFFPGDIITYIGDIDHCMYFIHKGAVEMLSEDSLYKEEVEDVLKEGQMFGFEQGIYMRIGHEFTYKVSEKAMILALRREDWIHLLNFYPASKFYLYDKNKEV